MSDVTVDGDNELQHVEIIIHYLFYFYNTTFNFGYSLEIRMSSWLSEIAEKAENILNQIDENASSLMLEDKKKKLCQNESIRESVRNDFSDSLCETKKAVHDEISENENNHDLTIQVQEMRALLSLQNQHKSEIERELNDTKNELQELKIIFEDYKIKAIKTLAKKSESSFIKLSITEDEYRQFTEEYKQMSEDFQRVSSELKSSQDLISNLELCMLQANENHLENINKLTFELEYEKRNKEEMSNDLANMSWEYRQNLEIFDRDRSEFRTTLDSKDEQIKDLTIKLSTQPKMEDFILREQHLTKALLKTQESFDKSNADKTYLHLKLEELQIRIKGFENEKERETQNNNFENFLDKRNEMKKSGYSVLEIFSVRLGLALKRYPIIRIFLIVYMVLLHIWVLLILFNSAPDSSTSNNKK